MPNSCDCWVVISNFTEKGITPRIYSEDIPIKETELKVLNTYYASILNYTTEDSIIGPLPVAYHPELFVLLYRFDIIDNNVNDKRVIAVKGKTLGLITIFYNTKYDEIFVNSRKEIFDLLISWIKKFDNISQIDDFHINKLSEQIKNIELLDSYSDQEMGTDEEYKLINRQLDFLAKFVRGEFNLQIISDSLTYLDTLKEVIFKYSAKSITNFKKDTNKELSEIKIGNLKIHLQSSQDYKEISKNKSFIYFAEIDDSYASQKTVYTFQNLVDSLANNEQCLLCVYSPNESFNLPESPLFDIASSATGKNLSMFELKDNQTLEPIIIFLYQLIERMQ